MTSAYGLFIPAPSAAACKILPEDLINLTSEPVTWPQSVKKNISPLYSLSICHSLMELLVDLFLLPLWMVSRNSSYLSLAFSFKPKSMAHSSGKLLYSNFLPTIIFSPSLSFILIHHGIFSMKIALWQSLYHVPFAYLPEDTLLPPNIA